MTKQSTGNKGTIVLVHGAFADATSWSKVISILLAEGCEVVAVQNPTASLAGDVEAVNRALEAVEGPVVLAGHSWGGVVISEAGVHEKVGALVYVAAFAPAAGQSVEDLFADYPPPEWFGAVSSDSGGFLKISAAGISEYFAPDLSDEEKGIVAAVQTPFAAAANGERTTTAAWGEKPSWYVVARNDRIIDPDLERRMAEKIGARTVDVDAGHVAMLSRPEQVAAVIVEAARSLSGASADGTPAETSAAGAD